MTATSERVEGVGLDATRDQSTIGLGTSANDASHLSLRGRRLVQTAAAFFLLVVLSSAPYIELPRLLVEPLTTNSWTYLYPYWGVALLSCIGSIRVIDRIGMSPALRRRLVPLLAFAALTLLSPLWAESAFSLPLDTLLVVLTLSAGVWFGIALDARQWTNSLFASLQALLLVSMLEVHYRPRFGISPYGDWVGVFGNRNTLAPMAGLAVLASFGLWITHRNRVVGVVAIAASALDFYVLHKTGNTTTWLSLFAAFAVLVVVGLAAFVRRPTSGTARGLKLTVLGGAVALGFTAIWVIAANADRASSLKDRRRVWSYLWDVSASHRLTGYGFGSFWRDDTKVAPISTVDFRWDAAHNSFMEIYIGMGLIGLALIVWLLVSTVMNLNVDIRRQRSLVSVFPAMLFAFLLMENMSESMILYNSLVWALLIAISFSGLRNDEGRVRISESFDEPTG